MDTLKIGPGSTLETALHQHFQAHTRTGSDVQRVEVVENTAYIAVQRGGLTRAYLCPLVHLDPERHPAPLVIVMTEDLACETQNPEPMLVSAGFLQVLTPPDLFLEGQERSWRERAQQHVERVAASSRGEVLLGRYTGACGGISYNPVAKEEFQRDATRYLKRLGRLLGWPPAPGYGKTGVSFNPGGIAVSGQANLKLQVNAEVSVWVQVSSGGLSAFEVSESGTDVMWRFESPGKWGAPFENRFPRWDTPGDLLAQMIQGATVGRPELHPRHLDKAA